jgi:hypothetical protein
VIDVDIARAQKYVDDGWVIVGVRKCRYQGNRHTPSEPTRGGWRVMVCDPATTCLHQLRSGKCRMDKDHRGRHSTVVFGCDGCGKTVRGTPASSHPDEGVAFCFLCVLDDRKRYGW